MTSVSVVIPSHNRPQLIDAAVASVLAQPETTEVIVVDDGSTPPVAAVGSLGNTTVRIVRNAVAQGPSRARNRGLDEATGDFVGFLDDDDVWLPGKLAACLRALEAHPEAGVAAHRTGYAPTGGADGAPLKLLTEPLRYFGTHQTPHPDSLLVRQGVAGKIRFAEDLGAAEDVDFAIELARVAPFVMIDAVLAVHGPDDVPSAIGVEKRIGARKELRHRHGDVLYTDNPSRAFYHVRLGHLLRQVSKPQAARSFATALRYQPRSVLAWRGLAATLLPASLARRISKQRRIGDT
ncbi:MAG TPA: glycosyltransferase family 2 protein [Acidimicrobiia bacterium]|jgi:glycosyltransferase involved in cell wall biosynthesis|nr:glycosyltransferase family 2 protein [Acidimicrobiia bacterium]